MLSIILTTVLLGLASADIHREGSTEPNKCCFDKEFQVTVSQLGGMCQDPSQGGVLLQVRKNKVFSFSNLLIDLNIIRRSLSGQLKLPEIVPVLGN